MNKNKAITVTVLFAVMLGAIDFGLFKLFPLGFFVLTGLLALFGFWELSKAFSAWLAEHDEPKLEPVFTGEMLPDDFEATIEDIMREVRDEENA